MTANDEAGRYIRANFQPNDRLAVVLLNKRSNAVIQRLAPAERMASPEFLEFLRRENAQRYEVYLSMNALRPDSVGRTKGDVRTIRHIYLDIDEDGTTAVERLMRRQDLPKPNYLINSSPGKWQVVWKVDGFAKQQAEELQRHLARECGADTAATDCARVLRLPGFYNHKYTQAFLVQAETLNSDVYGPDRFPKFDVDQHVDREPTNGPTKRNGCPRADTITQSERDWAYAKRALARGDSPALVAAAIASFRRYDKRNPQAYAARTVAKASAALEISRARNSIGEAQRR